MSKPIVLSRHAKERCAEMRVPTEVAKAILKRPNLTYPGNKDDRRVALSDKAPKYLAIYKEYEDVTVLVTLVFRSYEKYERRGAYAVPIGAGRAA